jgi:hypothetical protein
VLSDVSFASSVASKYNCKKNCYTNYQPLVYFSSATTLKRKYILMQPSS